ncbi:cytochrome P450 [Streptomyces subrutilus]|uniref:Cytochrome P450 n=1 Tax=Streptomyces subrutilus TaxID=36818 RepID=A0A5P2UE87_9ACTN|nr:cytochrome P450 [Streptomyces subrutilus]QEU77606.1 cytochrome P450 [Streptomyces subrutilus]GGZ64600.1 cytochrome P450 [Streptomyces subrutilus]
MTQENAAPHDGGTLDEIVSAVSRGAPEYRTCPHPAYAVLREQDPVCLLKPAHGIDTYLITRYDDARDALSDPRFSKDMRGALDTYHAVYGSFFDALDDNVLNSDPPRHTRLRRTLRGAFTPRRVEEMRAGITAIAERLLRECRARNEVDLMSSFAFPLPIAVLCELMGIAEEERPEILEHFSVVTRARFDPRLKAELLAAEEWLRERLGQLVAQTRAHPSDSFLGDLIRAEDALDDTELVSSMWVIFFAGHKTTAFQIGNTVLHLLLRPDQLDKLRRDPALVPRAVEEIVRFEGSVETSTFRYAAEDVRLRGTLIPKGSLVQIALSSANRDPEKFDAPDVLDVTREGIQGTHLGFGHGTHYCLGAPLARLELEIALSCLLREFPEMRLADPRTSREAWLKGPVAAFRGLQQLPLVLDPSTGPTGDAGAADDTPEPPAATALSPAALRPAPSPAPAAPRT